jgi:hypothetical protein
LGTMVPSPYAPGNMLPGYNAPQMTGGWPTAFFLGC